MPELPEVETVRQGLANWVIGRKISAIELLHPRGERATSIAPLNVANGARILDIRRRGKFLWFVLNRDFALLAHLGMSGQFLIEEKKSRSQKHLRVRIDCGDRRRELRFIDQRTFGWVGIDSLQESSGALLPSTFTAIAPDIFDEAFDRLEVMAKLAKKNVAIKKVLLDQAVMSGVGNIYADEALWQAKINPRRFASSLKDEEIKLLFSAIRSVFRSAIKAGGTSFDQLYINVNGQSGYFEVELEAYGKNGEPCSRCGAEIKRIVLANRSSHFCPKCQPMRKKSASKG